MKLTADQLELLRETPLDWAPQTSGKYAAVTFNTLERKGLIQRNQLETKEWVIRKTEDGAAASRTKKRLDLNSPSKICPGCGTKKDKETGYCKNNKAADGFQSRCKECSNASTKKWRQKEGSKAKERATQLAWEKANPDKIRASKKRFRKNNPESARASVKKSWEKNYEKYKVVGWKYELKKKYGLTEDRYYELLEEQDFGCAICGTSELDSRRKRFCVDHCHDNGVVRGLLCFACNVVLGNVNDSTERLNKCIQYLNRFPKNSGAPSPFLNQKGGIINSSTEASK